MALGDGIRRNLAKVSATERTRFINAILTMDTSKFFPDGVTYWDKQEDIHKNGHQNGLAVHGGIGHAERKPLREAAVHRHLYRLIVVVAGPVAHADRAVAAIGTEVVGRNRLPAVGGIGILR